jgi:hypothetical protein
VVCRPRSSPVARTEAQKLGKTCGSYCGAVRDPYYPDDAAHAYAARVVADALKTPQVAPSHRHGGGPPDEPLRAISLEAKIFYAHVHKAAGTNLIAYLGGLEGVTDCAGGAGSVVGENHVSTPSWGAFEAWWFAPAPACTFATLETPELGDVYRRVADGRKARARGSAASAGTSPTGGTPLPSEPHLISFYREPVARCRSHWAYEQELCHRQPLGIHAAYCQGTFLPKYGNANSTAVQAAFVAEHCTELVSRSLTAANGVAEPLAFLSSQLSFFGVTEHFLESVCLLLYQLGRFRRDMCTCEGGETLHIARELRPPLNEVWKLNRLRAIGVPALRMSDAELRARSPADVALYDGLLRLFKRRMHQLEVAVKARVWACKYR